MKTCHHTIIINAPTSKVWAILMNTNRYPDWNPLVNKIHGILQQGELIIAYIAPLKSYFPARIVEFEPERRLVWQGKLFSSSLIMGEHYYHLKDLGNGQTELQHGEYFTGLLSHQIPLLLLSKMQDAYQYHNEKLKIIAEQGNLLI